VTRGADLIEQRLVQRARLGLPRRRLPPTRGGSAVPQVG
jgi:hypothetical protein